MYIFSQESIFLLDIPTHTPTQIPNTHLTKRWKRSDCEKKDSFCCCASFLLFLFSLSGVGGAGGYGVKGGRSMN